MNINTKMDSEIVVYQHIRVSERPEKKGGDNFEIQKYDNGNV